MLNKKEKHKKCRAISFRLCFIVTQTETNITIFVVHEQV